MRTHQLHRAGSPRQHKNPDDDEDKQSLASLRVPKKPKTPAVFAM